MGAVLLNPLLKIHQCVSNALHLLWGERTAKVAALGGSWRGGSVTRHSGCWGAASCGNLVVEISACLQVWVWKSSVNHSNNISGTHRGSISDCQTLKWKQTVPFSIGQREKVKKRELCKVVGGIVLKKCIESTLMRKRIHKMTMFWRRKGSSELQTNLWYFLANKIAELNFRDASVVLCT